MKEKRVGTEELGSNTASINSLLNTVIMKLLVFRNDFWCCRITGVMSIKSV